MISDSDNEITPEELAQEATDMIWVKLYLEVAGSCLGFCPPPERVASAIARLRELESKRLRIKQLGESLSDYNNRKLRHDLDGVLPALNGIACPKCGGELRDDGCIVLLSHPAKQPVICQKCGHRDYRYI